MKVDRQPRVPLCLPVAVSLGLRDCWCLNISVSGLALHAYVDSREALPPEGEELELLVSLPDGELPLRLRACVEWTRVRLASVPLGAWSLTFGARFTSVSAEDLELIERYVESYRPRVAVLGASSVQQRALLQMQLEHELAFPETLEHAGKIGTPYAAIIVMGEDSERAVRVAEALASGASYTHPSMPRLSLEPRVIFAAPADPQTLVRLLNERAVFRSVDGNLNTLPQALHQAVDDFFMDADLQRLAREKVRERGATEHYTRAHVIDNFVHESAAMNSVVGLVKRVAAHAVPVLITGETGTGKEILARALHDLGPRSRAAFVVQDCGAVTESLLESELFGHVKGAFTGATSNQPGLFAVAHGGTIFLDEIENIGHVFQSKLLRVLETGEVRPVGSATTRRVDVRVVAATNRDLKKEVEAGRFRPDLYYRLDRFRIDVPPLRERPNDVLPIAHYWLKRMAEEMRVPVPTLSPEVERCLKSYEWPGNVRELRNVIERVVLLAEANSTIELQALPAAVVKNVRPKAAGGLRAQLDNFERQVLQEALAAHGGIVSRAAREVGVDEVTFARRARRVGLSVGRQTKSSS